VRVFDASALLAVLFSEPGAELAVALLEEGDGAVSAVNHGEIVARLMDRGVSSDQADLACRSLQVEVLPFTAAQALASGLLRTETRALGLSLGDRCCLALARSLDAEVVTADRPWKALKGWRFQFIR
jgi:PIN domain nuclease of toxin-antitoxin system